MPKFRNMRERVEYAYDHLNVDIFYEGNFRYTVFNHGNQESFEMLDEAQLDQVLESIWRDVQPAEYAG